MSSQNYTCLLYINWYCTVHHVLSKLNMFTLFRIFKLARHSTGLQALGNTMKSNYKELGLLFLLLGMGAIMFASLIYVFEKEDNESTFKTMFDAYWWAIITMTTVKKKIIEQHLFILVFNVLLFSIPACN